MVGSFKLTSFHDAGCDSGTVPKFSRPFGHTCEGSDKQERSVAELLSRRGDVVGKGLSQHSNGDLHTGVQESQARHVQVQNT